MLFDDPGHHEPRVDDDEAPGKDDLDGYTLSCPHCGGEMYADADVCPHCRSFVSDADFGAYDADRDQMKGWAVMIVILMIVLMLALMMM